MKQENKKSKKKILLYYLILAACLLVIAAVTVTVIFTVKRNKPSLSAGTDITNPDDNKGNEDDNKGNEGGNDDNKGNEDDDKNDNKPTTNVNGYILPMQTAAVTSTYDFIYDVTLDRYCVHQGMDFKGKTGDEVCAVLDGTVKEIVKDHVLDGSYVTLTHSNGVTTTYKFINVKENLKVGSTVKQGDVIGEIAAASGAEMKQGDHLHFEMKVNGKQADPNVYLDIVEK